LPIQCRRLNAPHPSAGRTSAEVQGFNPNRAAVDGRRCAARPRIVLPQGATVGAGPSAAMFGLTIHPRRP
jgi:hypothetical protein